MSRIYVDEILPKDASTISAADLQLPAGSVIQVVSNRTDTNFSTTGSSYVDTGLSATITPKYASSKILILVDQVGFASGGANPMVWWSNICRGSTIINHTRGQQSGSTGQTAIINCANYLDSPNTTDTLTYKTQAYNENGVSMYYNWGVNGYSNITLMEIAQ